MINLKEFQTGKDLREVGQSSREEKKDAVYQLNEGMLEKENS